MSKTKRMVVGTSCFIGVLGLLGCNQNESASSDGAKESQPVSIMAVLHTPEVPDKKIHEMIEEKTDTELEIQWVPQNNYEERLNAAFATGTLPQVLYISNPEMFYEAIRDDQFWEIGPYLDEFENLQNLKPEIMDNMRFDDKIYSLYQGRPLSRSGIIYRKDWADELGLSAPTTTDEVFEMLRAFTEDDPDGNGRDDTIGLTDRNELQYGAFKAVASWFGAPNQWGEKDGTITPEFMFDEYMDTLHFFREVHENGYMNRDFPVTSKTDQQDMFKTGEAGMYIGSMGDVETLYNDASALNPDLEYDVHNYVEGPHGEYGIWSIPGYSRMLLFPKSSIETEEDLKHILQFFDQLMEPELANLITWGVEGEHYTVEDGMARPIAENQQANDREVKPYLSIEIGEAETSGRYEGLSEYEPKIKAAELEKDNENYLIQDMSIGLNSDTYVRDGERLQEIMNDATYQFILGQLDEEGFERAVDNWKNQGGQIIMDEYTESYNELN
ncbi:extracellular solute-binding protein [Alkalicoccobacillus plakortidis]|uniref:Extracellular solute-binding protein n=1 Tax=Alkalicoccobacillus plakortidis TaxID=444060 RepID=A0ABT0XLU3_9BACI|nr:extracellular solute-binding protein [Alkalicoccobacillus plakortidis]MCM2676288.1 extracellular solute-binding protein [Alkalicoccobacillus plakortidis]